MVRLALQDNNGSPPETISRDVEAADHANDPDVRQENHEGTKYTKRAEQRIFEYSWFYS